MRNRSSDDQNLIQIPSDQRKRILSHGKSVVSEAVGKIELPDVLYHYTTGDGLIGILQNKKIWATNVGYMNDSEEFIQGAKALRREAESRFSLRYDNPENPDPISREDRILEALVNRLDSIIEGKSFRAFVACFSGCEDDLAQWRGYSGAQSKFSIGFDGERLGEMANSLTHSRDGNNRRFLRCFLAPAIYKRHQQKHLVRRMVDFILDQFPRDEDAADFEYDVDYDASWIDAYMKTGALALALLKNDRFDQEREWRLVVIPSNNDHVKFRNRASMLTPYLEISLEGIETQSNPSLNNAEVPMRNLWVGPSTHMTENAVAAKMLLDRPEYRHIAIKKSSVPYRNL